MLVPTLSASRLPDLIPLVDSLSSSLNPYSLIQNVLNNAKADLHKRLKSYSRFLLVLMIVHSILGLVSLVSLYFKVFKKDEDGKYRRFWLWRKHYFSPESRPHYVPNGHCIIEFLQLLGCAFLWLFSFITYNFCLSPERSSPGIYSTMAFWMATSFTPGFIGFWLNGWSTFYVVFTSPNRTNKNTGIGRIFVSHPNVMNILCIGVPVLLVLLYSGLGIMQAVIHQNLFNNSMILRKTLANLSNLWTPDNPLNPDNNRVLISILENILTEATHILYVFQLIGFTWTACSIFIIMFYTASTIGIVKMFQSTIDTARGPPAIMATTKVDKEVHRRPVARSSEEFLSDEGSEVSTPKTLILRAIVPPGNVRLLKHLKKNYFLLYTTWLAVIIAMGFIGTFGVVFGSEVKTVLSGNRPLLPVAMLTASAVTLSVGIFLSTLLTAIST